MTSAKQNRKPQFDRILRQAVVDAGLTIESIVAGEEAEDGSPVLLPSVTYGLSNGKTISVTRKTMQRMTPEKMAEYVAAKVAD